MIVTLRWGWYLDHINNDDFFRAQIKLNPLKPLQHHRHHHHHHHHHHPRQQQPQQQQHHQQSSPSAHKVTFSTPPVQTPSTTTATASTSSSSASSSTSAASASTTTTAAASMSKWQKLFSAFKKTKSSSGPANSAEAHRLKHSHNCSNSLLRAGISNMKGYKKANQDR